MKVLTTRELNRKTASVLDGVKRGESFELRRNGRAVGYIDATALYAGYTRCLWPL